MQKNSGVSVAKHKHNKKQSEAPSEAIYFKKKKGNEKTVSTGSYRWEAMSQCSPQKKWKATK